MAAVSPVASAISASSRDPAWAATPLPSGVTFNAGSRLLRFILEVPFSFGLLVVRSSKFPKQEGHFRAPMRAIRGCLVKRPG